jgi:hypothetical protein
MVPLEKNKTWGPAIKKREFSVPKRGPRSSLSLSLAEISNSIPFYIFLLVQKKTSDIFLA